MTTTLAAYPFLNVLLHTGTHHVLETEWLGFAGSADFRLALTEALRLARLHRVVGWVADDRRLGAVRPKDLAWTHCLTWEYGASRISNRKKRLTALLSTECIKAPFRD